MNVANASPLFTPMDAQELGRFSQSTAQQRDLEPPASMLRAHTLRCSVLPDIYAGQSRVSSVIELVCRVHVAV